MTSPATPSTPRPDTGSITVRAHAKLTFGLRITGVRDDGYHLIDAEMASLDLVLGRGALSREADPTALLTNARRWLKPGK